MVSPNSWEKLFNEYVSGWFDEYDLPDTRELSEDALEDARKIVDGGGQGRDVLHSLAFSEVKKSLDRLKAQGRKVPKFMENVSTHGLVKRTDKWIEYAQKKLEPILEKEEIKLLRKAVKGKRSPEVIGKILQNIKLTSRGAEREKEKTLAQTQALVGKIEQSFRTRIKMAASGREISSILLEAEESLSVNQLGRLRENAEGVLRELGG